MHTVVLVVLLGLDNSVCLCFCGRWPERSLHHRLSGHAVHHGIDGRVQRRQGVGENQPGPELGEIPSPSPSFPQYAFPAPKTLSELSHRAQRLLHFQPDKDFSGGRACRIDYKRRLCVLTATLCRRSLTVLQSSGHRRVHQKHSVWPPDTLR